MSDKKAKKEYTLKLTAKNRLLIGGLMPKSGGLAEQMLVRDIVTRAEFDKKERERMTVSDGGVGRQSVSWKGIKARTFTFSETEMTLLADQAARVAKENNVTQENLDIILLIKGTMSFREIEDKTAKKEVKPGGE